MPVHMIDCVQALHCESHNEPEVRDSGKYSSSQIAEMDVTVSRRPGRRVSEESDCERDMPLRGEQDHARFYPDQE